jgi:uncharacterized protein with FMN-binding domain
MNSKMTIQRIISTGAIVIAGFSPVSAKNLMLAQANSAINRTTSEFRNGTYTATGTYGGGPSHITVTLTVKDGNVTAVRVRPHATVQRSLQLQRSFAAAVPNVVVGKKLDQLRVGKLAGSSHTPQGFNDALDKIRQQARLSDAG